LLKIYNSLSKIKEPFIPINDNKVKIYVCGVTAYNYCHIGHARTYVIFDMIIRYLMSYNFDIYYIRNITDIDDKIINIALKNNESTETIVDKYVKIMHEDFSHLNLLKPNYEPKATNYIHIMISIIENLLNIDYAYLDNLGNVYFNINKSKNYGSLSNQELYLLNTGSRIKINNNKIDPNDFILWKATKNDNEPSWGSPWGKGRPGWHIECSAIIKHYLGDSIDIHGGGADLLFPHHENEKAQSEAVNETLLSKFWVHSGLVNFNNYKLSKSMNHVCLIRDLLKQYSGDIIRFYLISSHYRQQINYSEELLCSSKNRLNNIYNSLINLNVNKEIDLKKNKDNYFIKNFILAMNNDFNTPQAINILSELSKNIKVLKLNNNLKEANYFGSILIKLLEILGFVYKNDSKKFDKDTLHIDEQIKLRNKARDSHDWITADKIKEELLKFNIIIEDNLKNTFWKFK
jgi:cysteinyl-tRNA synthetase